LILENMLPEVTVLKKHKYIQKSSRFVHLILAFVTSIQKNF
jgi:hypothetical protein